MTQDNYLEQGYHIDRYHALEKDLLEFLEFIPLEFYPCRARQCIRSTYLADLLLRIGSNIDIFFKKTIECNREEESWKGKIAVMRRKDWNGYKELEPILKLSDEYVTIISTTETEKLYPFRQEGKCDGLPWSEKGVSLAWWNSYNKVKHEGRFDRATLDNVIQSLAALFILICRDKVKHVRKFYLYRYTDINPQWLGNVMAGQRVSGINLNICTSIFIKT